MASTLAYQISRNSSHLSCPLHHMNLSTLTSKEMTVIKVCCSYFRDEVLASLEKQFRVDFIRENIRFNLPVNEAGISASADRQEE